jgi:hypothetical protein
VNLELHDIEKTALIELLIRSVRLLPALAPDYAAARYVCQDGDGLDTGHAMPSAQATRRAQHGVREEAAAVDALSGRKNDLIPVRTM